MRKFKFDPKNHPSHWVVAVVAGAVALAVAALVVYVTGTRHATEKTEQTHPFPGVVVTTKYYWDFGNHKWINPELQSVTLTKGTQPSVDNLCTAKVYFTGVVIRLDEQEKGTIRNLCNKAEDANQRRDPLGCVLDMIAVVAAYHTAYAVPYPLVNAFSTKNVYVACGNDQGLQKLTDYTAELPIIPEG